MPPRGAYLGTDQPEVGFHQTQATLETPGFDPAEFLNRLYGGDSTITNERDPDLDDQRHEEILQEMGDSATSEQEAEAIHQLAKRWGVRSPFEGR